MSLTAIDWKLFATAFASVFVAEIGDKTQLAAFALAGGQSSKWTVFVAASLALIAATAIAVLAAGVVERYVPVHWIKRGAGVLFIVLGVLLLWQQRGGAEPIEPPPTADAPS